MNYKYYFDDISYFGSKIKKIIRNLCITRTTHEKIMWYISDLSFVNFHYLYDKICFRSFNIENFRISKKYLHFVKEQLS